MHRRVHVPQRKLVGGKLPVGVHVPFAQQELQLVFRELAVQPRKRNHVERQVPGGEPRVLPFVRHREHVAIEHMRPVGVSPVQSLRRRTGLLGIPLEPVVHDVVIELFRPQQPGVCQTHHLAFVVRKRSGNALGIERVGLLDAIAKDAVERRGERLSRSAVRCGPPQRHGHRALRRQLQREVRRDFRSHRLRSDRLGDAADHVIVKGVLARAGTAAAHRTAARSCFHSPRTATFPGLRWTIPRRRGAAFRASRVRRAGRRCRRPRCGASPCSLRAGSPSSMCCGTRTWARGAAPRRPARDCEPSTSPARRRARPWRIRSAHRSSGLREKLRCR